MASEYFKIALLNLRSRSLRSWLTISGIIIGIFLVVSLLSLSEGLKDSIMRELNMMGGDLIMVFPGDVSDMMSTMIGGKEIGNKDIEAIKRAEGVEVVLEMPYSGITVRHISKTKTAIIHGISYNEGIPLLRENMGWEVVEGDFPQVGKREVLVGNAVPKSIFPEMMIGDSIFIKGKEFFVSGVLRSSGNKQDDSMITIDLSDYRDITGKREGSPIAMAKILSGYNVDDVVKNIEYNLEDLKIRKKGEDKSSFSVMSSEVITEMVGGIVGAIQFAVIAFASIAIVVGGIGIMNTMYTSVRERTKEIGILKAVGARRRNIITIFLFEAGIIGFIGGIGGVLLGLLLALGVQYFLSGSDVVFQMEAHISIWLILFGLGFSFIIGCLSGYLPAKQASKLEPVDALRYE